MKKSSRICLILLNICILTSCEVQYFGHSYDVLWYYIAVPVAIFSVLCLALSHISIIHQTFKCPKCGAKFRPKWYEISSWLHINDDRVVKCPVCKKKGFCKRIDK